MCVCCVSHVRASHRKSARLYNSDTKLLIMVIVLSEREDRGQHKHVHGGRKNHIPQPETEIRVTEYIQVQFV